MDKTFALPVRGLIVAEAGIAKRHGLHQFEVLRSGGRQAQSFLAGKEQAAPEKRQA